MKIRTSWSVHPDADSAVTTAYQELLEQLGADPQFIFLHSTATYDSEVLVRRLRELAPQRARTWWNFVPGGYDTGGLS